MASLKEQIGTGEDMEMSKMGQASENTKALADAKESLADTEKSLEIDTKFLAELRDMCKKIDDQWLIRAKTRKDEILAVSEAIGMLTNDEAKDHFSSTFSFLQVSKQDERRAQAAAALRQAYRKTHNAMFMELAESAQLDAFTKVKAA